MITEALLAVGGVAAVWVLNGVRKALLKPRIRRVAYSCAGGVHRLEIERQELSPPWRTLKEVWVTSNLKPTNAWARESDGWLPRVLSYGCESRHWLQERLDNLQALAAAEKQHTEAVLAETN